MSPDKDGVIVVKTAENGVGREHAGCFRAPVCDCTRMPTKEHFDLGTREHEAAKRMEYQARLISRQMVGRTASISGLPNLRETPRSRLLPMDGPVSSSTDNGF